MLSLVIEFLTLPLQTNITSSDCIELRIDVRRWKPASLRLLKTLDRFTSAVLSGQTKAQTDHLFIIILYLFSRLHKDAIVDAAWTVRQQPVNAFWRKKGNILRKLVTRTRLRNVIKCWLVTLVLYASLATVHTRTRSCVQQRDEMELKAAWMAFKTLLRRRLHRTRSCVRLWGVIFFHVNTR